MASNPTGYPIPFAPGPGQGIPGLTPVLQGIQPPYRKGAPAYSGGPIPLTSPVACWPVTGNSKVSGPRGG